MAAEELKWRNRRQLQADQSKGNILEHNPKQGRLMSHAEAALGSYDINGKAFHDGTKRAPPLLQPNTSHWLCQVNGMTADYNIVNNLPAHPHITRCREVELDRLREASRDIAAGDVQPQRNISSYDIIGYPPVHQRKLQGVTERHHSLFS